MRPSELTSSNSMVASATQLLVDADQLHIVKGNVSIETLGHPQTGELDGWAVTFNNTAPARAKQRTTGFTGTLVLLNDRLKGAKNAGLGLESMPCPALSEQSHLDGD